jgi:hypothetical protein
VPARARWLAWKAGEELDQLYMIISAMRKCVVPFEKQKRQKNGVKVKCKAGD